MSRIRVNELTNATGDHLSTPQQLAQGRAKAWFNLNGTGVIAPRDDFNVSSYVDNGTGDYTANVATTFPNANYATALNSCAQPAGVNSTMVGVAGDVTAARTASAFRFFTRYANSDVVFDTAVISGMFFGD